MAFISQYLFALESLSHHPLENDYSRVLGKDGFINIKDVNMNTIQRPAIIYTNPRMKCKHPLKRQF
jgi:hypothetical protein